MQRKAILRLTEENQEKPKQGQAMLQSRIKSELPRYMYWFSQTVLYRYHLVGVTNNILCQFYPDNGGSIPLPHRG
jgi:hypothetical protein